MSDRDRTAPLRVACRTLGCRLNRCDTESALAALRRQTPLVVVPWDEPADLYFLNSCTVTAKAAQECRRLARQVRARRPQARVVVAGCYAQTEPQALAALPAVDAVLGQAVRDRAADWLPGLLAGDGPRVLVEPLREHGPLAPSPAPTTAADRSRAFVKVQDGCDLRCAYCQIWRARGPARSLPPADAAAEVRRLCAAAGYREVVLTGVHLGAWGRDLSPPSRLCDLLAGLCRAVPGVRLRLGSLHPDEVTPDLLALIAATPQIRPHLHLSLQSGSASVLARMGRRYGPEVAAVAAAGLQQVDAAAGLGADVIAGYPGESAMEFAETIALLERLPLSYLHVFRYSPRPGTAAAATPALPGEVVRERAQRLRALGRAKQQAFEAGLVGARREAVLERAGPTGRRATLDNYAAVAVTSPLPAGVLVAVRPTAQRGGRLVGEVLDLEQERTA